MYRNNIWIKLCSFDKKISIFSNEAGRKKNRKSTFLGNLDFPKVPN
jgi:hypothetical protein